MCISLFWMRITLRHLEMIWVEVRPENQLNLIFKLIPLQTTIDILRHNRSSTIVVEIEITFSKEIGCGKLRVNIMECHISILLCPIPHNFLIACPNNIWRKEGRNIDVFTSSHWCEEIQTYLRYFDGLGLHDSVHVFQDSIHFRGNCNKQLVESQFWGIKCAKGPFYTI